MNSRIFGWILIAGVTLLPCPMFGQQPQDCTPLTPACYKPTEPKQCSDYERNITGTCSDNFCVYQQLQGPEGIIIINLGCEHRVVDRLVGAELFYLSRVRYTNPYFPGGYAPENGFDKVNCTKTHCIISQECLGCMDPETQIRCETEEDPDVDGPKIYTNMVPAGNMCIAGNQNVPNHPESGNPVPAPEDSPTVPGGPGL